MKGTQRPGEPLKNFWEGRGLTRFALWKDRPGGECWFGVMTHSNK